jgi:hypothetical protein
MNVDIRKENTTTAEDTFFKHVANMSLINFFSAL